MRGARSSRVRGMSVPPRELCLQCPIGERRVALALELVDPIARRCHRHAEPRAGFVRQRLSSGHRGHWQVRAGGRLNVQDRGRQTAEYNLRLPAEEIGECRSRRRRYLHYASKKCCYEFFDGELISGDVTSLIKTVQVIPAAINTPAGTSVKRIRTGMR
jgi:hypothetical protein